ncbi:probable myosin light chain kinase DDB_G0282429 [Oppia nitens]|uniref:probable myosin light chain kinase DDB_G0282429 n=1 Tax=Oppia nitens TaxID=1686743 RepID=UPI0023DCC034|nr:probable myosin light chain kinase DDB_G0282429 [Oppia nitens]
MISSESQFYKLNLNKTHTLEDNHQNLQNESPFNTNELNFLESRYIKVDLDNCIGKGSFGTLYVALSHQHSYVVLKRYENYTDACHEAEVLRLFGKVRAHPNIITFFESYVYNKHLYLLLEYSNTGDLTHFYEKTFRLRQSTEEDVFKIFKDVYSGVEHMHNNGWAHRDLKFENILAFRDVLKPINTTFKLIDFGSAVFGITNDGKCKSFRKHCGSPFTMAPEVTLMPYNAFLYDSYSLGVILYGLFHDQQYPHSVDTNDINDSQEWLISYNKKKQDLNAIMFRDDISQELKSLIMGLIVANPINRTIVQHIKESKWWHIRHKQLVFNNKC